MKQLVQNADSEFFFKSDHFGALEVNFSLCPDSTNPVNVLLLKPPKTDFLNDLWFDGRLDFRLRGKKSIEPRPERRFPGSRSASRFSPPGGNTFNHKLIFPATLQLRGRQT